MNDMIISNIELDALSVCRYEKTDIGLVSDRAVVSVGAAGDCDGIGGYGDILSRGRDAFIDVDACLTDISRLVGRYGVKEGLITGGEPTLHPRLFDLISGMSRSGLKRFGIATGDTRSKDTAYWGRLAKSGIGWIDVPFAALKDAPDLYIVYRAVKDSCPSCRVRANAEVLRGRFGTLESLAEAVGVLSTCCDEIRVFPGSGREAMECPEYADLFGRYAGVESGKYTVISNRGVPGFSEVFFVPSKKPVTLAVPLPEECRARSLRNAAGRKIDSFKCLAGGGVSLSWDECDKIDL